MNTVLLMMVLAIPLGPRGMSDMTAQQQVSKAFGADGTTRISHYTIAGTNKPLVVKCVGMYTKFGMIELGCGTSWESAFDMVRHNYPTTILRKKGGK